MVEGHRYPSAGKERCHRTVRIPTVVHRFVASVAEA
ncbi:protein of unknown function [Methylacidimicrobium sp. AP8]|nr:protein of unknown function [Methylacidimicrobium sp. AP8]